MAQMIRNPATLAALGEAPQSSARDIDRAVAAARGAAGRWSRTAAAERAALLAQAAARVRGEARALAELSSRESGVPRCEALDDLSAAAASLDHFSRDPGASPVGGTAGGEPPVSPGSAAAAILVPFTLALPVMAAGVGRCLAAGLAVVCKLPADNPLGALGLARAFEVFPPGVVQVVTGGADAGRALSGHAGIDEVLFTGSRSAGLEVAAVAGAKHLDLEMGAVDAQIVCRDADLELAVPAVAWNRLRNGGQSCMSGGHVFVDRSIAAEFVDRMHPCMGFLEVDDPANPSADLGPLISLDAAKKIEDQVGRTLRAGARLILGGRRFRPSGLPGHFFQPTLLTDVAPGGVPMREEMLGPVITVTPVSGLAEAMQMWAKLGSPLALSAVSIYTSDAEAAARAAAEAAEGTFRINDPATLTLDCMSGLRHRGLRRALGAGDVDARCVKRVEVARAIERKPWWFPYIDRARAR